MNGPCCAHRGLLERLPSTPKVRGPTLSFASFAAGATTTITTTTTIAIAIATATITTTARRRLGL
jgi:hypothetical protein